MSEDRLQELRRQRALIQSHLDWLNAEIARQSPAKPAAPAVPPAAAESAPVEIPPEYQPDPQGSAHAAKRGCLFVFVALALAGLAFLVAIYFWRYRDRPLLYAPVEETSRTGGSAQA